MAADPNVCRHEAAHALVMLATGAPVGIVTVVPTANSLGHAQVDLAALPRNGTSAATVTGWQQVCVLVIAAAWSVAGPLADGITGRSGDGCDEAAPDAELVEALTGVPGALWLPLLNEVVASYLRVNWPSVAVIAAALQARATLHDADLRALVGEVPR